jgi:hypothetical protein
MKKLFHRKGITYFWALNHRCDMADLEPQIQAYAAAGTSAVCLHPRAGLLLPYGSKDWFDFVREVSLCCQKHGLDVWLYDEDPFPSGNAGGWITAEHPEFQARQIQMNVYAPGKMEDPTLFCFPTGRLLWCGLVEDGTREVAERDLPNSVDMTANVGMLRRKWHLWEHWDSRYFYPETPTYVSPRCETRGCEFGVRVPTIEPGMKLVSFVAVTSGEDTTWDMLADTLNPACTQEFIKRTHERYRQSVGDLFGNQIKAIFTDEPKFMAMLPWTPGMFEDFQERYQFDLRPRLIDLFTQDSSTHAAITRLCYRQWCNDRLRKAWFEPVSKWCHAHDLFLVGHVSPEDDLVQQSDCVGNLFPIYQYFDLAGLDLIIPAVGDARHPLINVGIIAATSVAQQRGMMGVMSETGAAAGLRGTAQQLGHILAWQTVLGMTSPVIHGSLASTQGPRSLDSPPNYGPTGDLWPAMQKVHRRIEELQEHIRDKQQVAPVAILWPIRSFNMCNIDWLNDTTHMRRDFVSLLQLCLDHQVGTHILDEADLQAATIHDGQLHVGRARYAHLLVPSSIAWHKASVAMLHAAMKAGIHVRFVGQSPRFIQDDQKLIALDLTHFNSTTAVQVVSGLPRLMDLLGDATDIRCTGWFRADEPELVTRLVMNLRSETWIGLWNHRVIEMAPGEVRLLEQPSGSTKQDA